MNFIKNYINTLVCTSMFISMTIISCSKKSLTNGIPVNSMSIEKTNDMKNLKGKIHFLISRSYLGIKDIKSFKKTEPDILDTIEYNKFGSIISFITDGIRQKTVPKYDEYNNEIESNLYYYNGTEELVHKTTHTYDSKGNNLESKAANYIRLFEYNNGNLVLDKEIENDTIININKYIYDSEGNCTEMFHYKKNNILWQKRSYKRDNKGNIIEDKYVHYPDNTEGIIKYDYLKFDSNGNWTERNEYASVFNRIRERIIIYY